MKSIGLSLVLIAASSQVYAGGSSVAEQSAVAGGTAGAGTARADDSSAAWYNPAALADGGGLRVGFGFNLAMPDISATAMDGTWSRSAERDLKTPFNLHVADSRGRAAYGLAVGVPFGGGVGWPDEWEGRHEIRSTQLRVFRVAPFFAWRFGKVSVSAGPQLDIATLQITRGLDFVDTEGQVDLAMNATGFGAHASIFAEVHPEISVGLSYKSRTKLSYSGDADFNAPAEFTRKTIDQDVRTSQTMPDRFAVGANWNRGPLSLLADVELTMWSVNKELVIDFDEMETPDVVQDNRWRNTLSTRLGAEYRAAPALTLRGGAFYDPTPAPTTTLRPSSPDASRLGATVGASYQFAQGLSVDAFYQYMHLLSRPTEDMDALQAEYGGRVQYFGLGIRYHMGQ